MKVVTIMNINGEMEVQNFYSDDYDVINIAESTLPEKPETTDFGKDLKLMYNIETESLYWKEVDRPLTAEEESVKLKEQVQLIQTALDELILGGAL